MSFKDRMQNNHIQNKKDFAKVMQRFFTSKKCSVEEILRGTDRFEKVIDNSKLFVKQLVENNPGIIHSTGGGAGEYWETRGFKAKYDKKTPSSGRFYVSIPPEKMEEFLKEFNRYAQLMGIEYKAKIYDQGYDQLVIYGFDEDLEKLTKLFENLYTHHSDWFVGAETKPLATEVVPGIGYAMNMETSFTSHVAKWINSYTKYVCGKYLRNITNRRPRTVNNYYKKIFAEVLKNNNLTQEQINKLLNDQELLNKFIENIKSPQTGPYIYIYKNINGKMISIEFNKCYVVHSIIKNCGEQQDLADFENELCDMDNFISLVNESIGNRNEPKFNPNNISLEQSKELYKQ